ncbi:IS66 family insertion sequence element accessory protein TnpA [Sphingobacterium faecium]|jgi:hypothetical protein|uniref:IS66 family insertion sequence element accessory protein TnpA n=1 Tax=Sphingobacterium faecium TaxID=34087 RepID=UPI000B9BE826|nr:hypothetical protein [Sphingobacterium faecium]WGQ14512.1 IS66 family insertion sequence element accessory protein TnpB [Sphingobacterium faecium]
MNTAQEKRSQMLSLVEKWRGSGQPQQEFCSFHGIKLHTLSYWIGVSKEEKSPSGFIEVLPKNNAIQKIEVIYPNGVKVNAGVDLALVSKLIHLY